MVLGLVNDMKFVAAASYAASPFVSLASEKARRGHDLSVRLCVEALRCVNAKPLPAYLAFGGVGTAEAGEIVQLQNIRLGNFAFRQNGSLNMSYYRWEPQIRIKAKETFYRWLYQRKPPDSW